MNYLSYLYEPRRLLLVWQPPLGQTPRTRRVVAEILRTPEQQAILRYLTDSEDYILATEEGFQGYPAFRQRESEHSQGVIDAFMRRLPPRNREDFGDYLARHRIPTEPMISDFSLLAYTGARLPSDGFEIAPDLSGAHEPFDLVIEVAGYRHQKAIPPSELPLGDEVAFEHEENNIYDKNAVRVMYHGEKIGYVSRALAPSFRAWLRDRLNVTATIERVNGKPERPLIYLFVKVR